VFTKRDVDGGELDELGAKWSGYGRVGKSDLIFGVLSKN